MKESGERKTIGRVIGEIYFGGSGRKEKGIFSEIMKDIELVKK